MRAEGWTVSGGAPLRAGWPAAAELVIPEPALVGGDALVPGGMAWRGEQVRLRLSPLAPRLLEMLPEGVQRVRVATLPEASVTAAALAVHVPLSGEGATELGGQAVRVAVKGGSVEAATLRADAIPAGVRVEAGAVALPQGRDWPLGATMETVSGEVTVSGAPGPAPPGAMAAEQAARWRDAGGRVDVPRFALRWGPLSASGSGSGGTGCRAAAARAGERAAARLARGARPARSGRRGDAGCGAGRARRARAVRQGVAGRIAGRRARGRARGGSRAGGHLGRGPACGRHPAAQGSCRRLAVIGRGQELTMIHRPRTRLLASRVADQAAFPSLRVRPA